MLAAQAVTEGTLDLGLCVPTAKNTLFFSVGNLPIRADRTGQYKGSGSEDIYLA